jgi:hypothetical protein
MIPVQYFNYIEEGDYPEYTVEVVKAEPIPELPAEVWHRTEASGDERMKAVRLLCGG